MFTGIVSAVGKVTHSQQSGDLRLRIECPWSDLALGESVACNGVCLTVVAASSGSFEADLSAETLARTAPRWEAGANINLERALKVGERLSGHFVTGHVDGLAVLREVTASGGSHVLTLEAPPALSRFIAEKGSVTLDGISLTVNAVEGARFTVNIIPHTWQETNLSQRKQGDAVNLEIDVLARYAARLTEH